MDFRGSRRVGGKERMMEREKENKRETGLREKHRLVASCTCLHWGLNPQPQCMPWLRIQLGTFRAWDNAPTN